MGRRRKYCSYQPYLDYIGVSERERREWNKEEEEQEKKMNLPFDKIHDPLSSWGRLIFPWFGKDGDGKRRWLALFYIKKTFLKKGIRRTDKYGFHNCRIYGN